MSTHPILVLALATLFLNSSSARSASPQGRMVEGLTANGLMKILSSPTVANALEDHSLHTVQIEFVKNENADGFLLTFDASVAGTSETGILFRPCIVTVSAMKPSSKTQSPYALAVREVCAAPTTNEDVNPIRTAPPIVL